MDIVLVQPEIAPNTGAIIRLAANIGANVHLVEPLGFELDDRSYARGGLDYHELTTVTVHADLDTATRALPGPWWGFTSHAATRYTDAPLDLDDVFVFGTESTGLTDAAEARIGPDRLLGIPMRAGSRSLNLANAVSVVAYEVWRRHDFPGAAIHGTMAERLTEPPF
ncbi:MAG: tRNA (cytidine(34)-2'-O)-methyltransferase [Actinomycetota bacterium]